jgi:NitT/TauT family transport system substrate-binding protein
MKSLLRGIINVCVFMFVALIFVGCGENSKNNVNANDKQVATNKIEESVHTIRIAYLPITHSLPILEEAEASADNLLTGVKVELVRFGSWPELLDAINSGDVDGAVVLAELAMKLRETQGNNSIKAVALGHRDGNVIVVSKEINSFSDLKGKVFAIPHRQSSHHILVREAMKKNGMTEKDIKLIELSPTEMPASLYSGKIAGYSVAEPFGAMSVNLGIGKVLYTSEQLWPNSICCLLVLRSAFIEKHYQLAKNFVKGFKDAGIHLGNHEYALKVAVKYFKQNTKVLQNSLQWIHFDDLELTKNNYESLVNKTVEYGLTSAPPTYEEFVENEL